MKKIFGWALLIVILMIVALPKFKNMMNATSPNTKMPPKYISVYYKIIEPESFQSTISVTGTVFPNENAILSSASSGRIVSINFQEGQWVAKGTLLAKVDDKELTAELSKINIAIKAAEQRLGRINALLNSGASSQEEKELLNSDLEKLQSEKLAIMARIEKSVIRAPFSGTLGLKNMSVGKYVQAGEPIVSIQDVNTLKIDFSLPEAYAFQIKAKDKFRFTIEGIPDTLEGQVKVLEPYVDIASRTVKVRGEYHAKGKKIFPGMYAHIMLQTSQSEPQIMIPSEALIPEMTGYSVYVAKNDTAIKQAITIGKRLESTVQILKGLQCKDTLIVSGLMQLKPKMAVKLKKS
jgi:membrane fusion protein (multidrug efflux system)